VDWMRTFIRERPAHVRSHLAEHFGLGEAVSVRIGSTGPGAVRLEDYTLPAGGATLRLLRGTRVRLSALPDSGAVLDAGPAPDMSIEVDGPMSVDYRFRRQRSQARDVIGRPTMSAVSDPSTGSGVGRPRWRRPS
jgi:hypothetical protein